MSMTSDKRKFSSEKKTKQLITKKENNNKFCWCTPTIHLHKNEIEDKKVKGRVRQLIPKSGRTRTQ